MKAEAVARAASVAACAASLLATIAISAWLLRLAPHGIEFSDEGFYLAWISDPFLYDASATGFGFVYHPLYLLLQGDLAWVRQANVLLSFGACYWMFASLTRREGTDGAGTRRIASAGLALAALAVFSGWLLTPNYNTLVLQAFALAVTGLCLTLPDRRHPRLGAVLIGIGGALAFLAKPSSAALLALFMTVAVLANGKSALRTLSIAAFTAAISLLAFALAVDGSPQAFADRLRDGAHVMQLLDGKYTLGGMLRWEWWALTSLERTVIGATALAGASAAWLAARESAAARIVALASAGAGSGMALALLLREAPVLPPSLFVNMLLAGAALGALGAALMADARHAGAPVLRRWLQALCIAALPAAHALGSNNAYWHVGGYTAVFWVAGGVFALSGSASSPLASARALLPIAAATQLVVVVLLRIGDSHPYRQTVPAGEQHTPMPFRGSTLRTTPEVAAYFAQLVASGRAAGLAPGTPVIDLTGQSPTALHALEARAIGLPWWAGGYPGSNALAAWVLQRLRCDEVAAAWLMIEPAGPRALDPRLLAASGAVAERDYDRAFVITTPNGAGGYAEARQQVFLRPRRDPADASRACAIARESGP